ncbi:MAG: hypothetical protein LBM04_05095, partial [Opitutaceae bacterium]|nr:hypothetical protein [Opitutaceae bacterium]
MAAAAVIVTNHLRKPVRFRLSLAWRIHFSRVPYTPETDWLQRLHISGRWSPVAGRLSPSSAVREVRLLTDKGLTFFLLRFRHYIADEARAGGQAQAEVGEQL